MSDIEIEEEEVELEDTPEHEDRVDEFAISVFEGLGYTGRLPDELVEVYLAYKKVKDFQAPGRLSSEGFATVVCMYKFLV